MTIDDINLKGTAQIHIIVACGAGAPGDIVTLPGLQARQLVASGYAALLSVREGKGPEAAMKPEPATRGGRAERRG